MKRIFLLALSLAPASAFAQLTAFTFLNGFSGANAVPANSSLGTGVINTLEYDASVGAFGTLTLDVDFSGLDGPTIDINGTSAHIHGPAAPGATELIAFNLNSPIGVTSGGITGTWGLGSQSEVEDLFGGLYYVNLHTDAVPSG
ncbi:MAG: CHRD domain-containing protein [Opitutales bacterium]